VCFPSRPSILILYRCLANVSLPARVFPATNAFSERRFDGCFAEMVRDLVMSSTCSHQNPVELEAGNPVMPPNCYRPTTESRGIRFFRRTGGQ
jgi:hypothetical protein